MEQRKYLKLSKDWVFMIGNNSGDSYIKSVNSSGYYRFNALDESIKIK